MPMLFFIDDDAAAHTFHKIMAKKAEYKDQDLHCFMSVDEAMNCINAIIESGDFTSWPSHIFIDLNMPLKTGYDFVAEFEAVLPAADQTPELYFVSSSKNPVDIEKVAKLDLIKGFETKFLQKEFFAAIKN